MNKMTNDYFEIRETIDTATGKIHIISWKYYFPGNFLKAISRQATECAWMKSGDYSIKRLANNTIVSVSDRILKDFAEVVNFWGEQYGGLD